MKPPRKVKGAAGKRRTGVPPRERKSPLLPPPPKLPEEVEELFAAQDFVELEYRRMERIRQQPNKPPEARQALAEHDAVEKRLAEAPDDLIREAHEAMDRGTSLLLKLVRSRKTLHVIQPTEKGLADGVKPHAWDEAFECWLSRLDYQNRQLIRLAEIDTPQARQSLFYQALFLTKAFLRLAQAFPEDFRDAAESSLTMPSLRARTLDYTADAQAIAEGIHLAEKHPASLISDNRERLGALCHALVAELVAEVDHERRTYANDVRRFERMKEFHETAEAYRDVQFEDWMKGHYYPTLLEGLMVSAKLPDLKADPESWWKLRILPMVKEEFRRVAKRPLRNAALWEELQGKTPKHTHAAMRRLMEKSCRNKLFRIAKACP